jgi:hypothetical protein
MATQTVGAAQAAAGGVAGANGPEDDVTDWLSIDWRQAEDDVRRLRQRIFTASQAGEECVHCLRRHEAAEGIESALLSVREPEGLA